MILDAVTDLDDPFEYHHGSAYSGLQKMVSEGESDERTARRGWGTLDKAPKNTKKEKRSNKMAPCKKMHLGGWK